MVESCYIVESFLAVTHIEKVKKKKKNDPSECLKLTGLKTDLNQSCSSRYPVLRNKLASIKSSLSTNLTELIKIDTTQV